MESRKVTHRVVHVLSHEKPLASLVHLKCGVDGNLVKLNPLMFVVIWKVFVFSILQC